MSTTGWEYKIEVGAQTTTHKGTCEIYVSSRPEADSLRVHILDGRTSEVSCEVRNAFAQGNSVLAVVDLTPNAPSMLQGDGITFISP
jgi:hypothetical protein